ncbi:MAG: LamG domain-containing protein, partial [Selenomonadaceae bacterium]|nr:LamG domain-containing protein [Selenomonadaceae bacterium]
MDTTFLKVWLPFDESTTKDLCWNGWTAYGSPTIQDNALYLPGSSSYLAMDGGITLGGQNFTIRGKFNMDSSSGSYCRIFSLHKASQTVDNVINLRRNASNAGLVVDCMGVMNSAFGVTLNTIHHFELDYIHGENKLRVFIDGTLVQTITVTIPQTTFDYCWLGRSNYSSDGYFVGSIDEFQIFDGVALHTTNFTPPTDEDYIQGKLAFGAANFNFTADVQRNVSNTVEVSFDVERKVKTKWRYVNPGTADTLTITGTTLTNLSADKSKTGTAFYQTQRVKCFDLAATPEVWMKFDVYFDGSNRWRAYNDGSAGSCGICSYSDGDFGMWQNNNRIQDFSGICKTNQLQTVLLHMVSGSSDGVIEAWVDGVEIHTYTGDVNHGDDFADIYLQSDGSGTFFSNVIISNVEIKLDEGYHTISLDTERRISNIVDFFSDVERNIIQPVIVPLIGEHFNHCVESIKIFRDKPQPIILPKKSVAYIRATSDGAIKIFSDVDTTGKRINSENNSLSGELDLCELVFIKPDLPTNASKKIIRKLFPRLEKSNLYGTEKLNDAVYFASEGKFQTWRAVIDKFINDLDNAATYTDFLENYCDIVLDNDDTGAITGSDAGGVITKTAASVVPEVTAPENWVVPEAGSTVTINGLNVVFPSNGSSGNGFTAAEEHIMAGLNSVWIKQSLDLIEESFGLSFNDEEAGTKTITVTFKYDSNYSATAAVSYSYQLNTNKFRDLNLIINMAYYAEIDTTSEDGLLVPYSSRYYTAGYLDRVIAHEMTHAIMASAIPYFNGMPTYIKEGAAELVHGIDDLRTNTIIELLTTQKDTLKNILKGLSSPSGAQSYAAGYIFLRYLAKQASGDEIPETMLITNLFIDDGGTGQLFFPDVLRTLIKTTEDNFDVEILDVIPVEFLADIKRDLLTRLILFPRNSEDFFSDVNNPFLRSRRTASPPNTVGLQSFELTIAEQQITDQVKFTGIIPFDIMQQVKGQYFDYNFNMRVERVQQQGILYSCDCCFDIDQLLFTQMNYKIPPMTWSYKVDGEIVGEIKTVEVKTYYPPASEHVKKIAAALGLNPVMQFDDFLSTV